MFCPEGGRDAGAQPPVDVGVAAADARRAVRAFQRTWAPNLESSIITDYSAQTQGHGVSVQQTAKGYFFEFKIDLFIVNS